MKPENLDLQALDTNICTSIFLMKGVKVLFGHRHYKPDNFKKISLWTTPGGRCEKGEMIDENLRRETVEETGITDVVIKQFLGIVPGAKEGDVLYVYRGETHQDAVLMEPHKFSEWHWFYPSEPPKPFINPEALALFQQSVYS